MLSEHRGSRPMVQHWHRKNHTAYYRSTGRIALPVQEKFKYGTPESARMREALQPNKLDERMRSA